MKALVLQQPGQLVMEDCENPIVEPDEILIKTKAATICTSDLNDIRDNPFGIDLPMIMGHEGSGVVAAVGNKVEGFSIGDRVVAHPVIPCGQCDSCRRNLTHLCDNMGHLAINKGGVFAEYFSIRSDRVRKIPEGLSFAMASLMEPICVCMEAIERASTDQNSNVLIIGDGPFGLIISKLLKKYNPKKVILTGRHQFRMDFAEADIAINEREVDNVLDAIIEATGGVGVDSAILCVGSSLAVDTAIASLRARGTLSVFSAVQPNPTIDLFKVHVKELNICGSCNDMNYMDEALLMLSDNSLGLDQLVTHELPFSDWEKAFNLAAKGKDEAIKVSLVL